MSPVRIYRDADDQPARAQFNTFPWLSGGENGTVITTNRTPHFSIISGFSAVALLAKYSPGKQFWHLNRVIPAAFLNCFFSGGGRGAGAIRAAFAEDFLSFQSGNLSIAMSDTWGWILWQINISLLLLLSSHWRLKTNILFTGVWARNSEPIFITGSADLSHSAFPLHTHQTGP